MVGRAWQLAVTVPAPFTSRSASPNVMVISVPPHTSVAVAVPVAEGSFGWPHSTTAFGGQAITGGVVSTVSISCTHCDELPHGSVAVQVRSMVGRA